MKDCRRKAAKRLAVAIQFLNDPIILRHTQWVAYYKSKNWIATAKRFAASRRQSFISRQRGLVTIILHYAATRLRDDNPSLRGNAAL